MSDACISCGVVAHRRHHSVRPLDQLRPLVLRDTRAGSPIAWSGTAAARSVRSRTRPGRPPRPIAARTTGPQARLEPPRCGRGVNPRFTSLRYAVCRGGSVTIIIDPDPVGPVHVADGVTTVLRARPVGPSLEKCCQLRVHRGARSSWSTTDQKPVVLRLHRGPGWNDMGSWTRNPAEPRAALRPGKRARSWKSMSGRASRPRDLAATAVNGFIAGSSPGHRRVIAGSHALGEADHREHPALGGPGAGRTGRPGTSYRRHDHRPAPAPGPVATAASVSSTPK